MIAKATAPFLDLKANVDRATGDVFECSEERFEEINSTQFGTLAERVDGEPEQAEELEAPARKPARRKKAAPASGKAEGE